MSDFADSVAFADQTQIAITCEIAAAALFFYDYLITFGSEVSLFWSTESVGASALFLLSRYFTFVVQVLQLVPPPSSFQGSVAITIVFMVLAPLQYLPWAAFSALRSYALWEGPSRRVIAVTVFALSSVPTIINLIKFHWISFADFPTEGFQVLSSLPLGLAEGFTLVSRICLIVADIMVLSVTWYRTHEAIKISQMMAGRQKRSFAGTLLRDGTFYFLTLLVLNVLQILTSFFSGDLSPIWGLIPNFTEPITAILTGRFLINLQRVRRKLTHPTSRQLTREDLFQSPFIASLGAQLSFHGDGDHAEGWEEEAS